MLVNASWVTELPNKTQRAAKVGQSGVAQSARHLHAEGWRQVFRRWFRAKRGVGAAKRLAGPGSAEADAVGVHGGPLPSAPLLGRKRGERSGVVLVRSPVRRPLCMPINAAFQRFPKGHNGARHRAPFLAPQTDRRMLTPRLTAQRLQGLDATLGVGIIPRGKPFVGVKDTGIVAVIDVAVGKDV